jgi:O-antigen/teichoic acid export membrane protein
VTAGSQAAPTSRWRELIRGFGMLAAGEVAARILGLASVVAMAQALGPDGFGIVALGTTLVAWTALGVDAGTELLAVRDLGRAPQRLRAIAEPLLGLRLTMALALGAVLVLVALVAGGGDAETLALFALVLPALALNPRFMAVAVRASAAVAVGNVLGQAVLLAGVLALVGMGDVERVPILVAVAELAYASVVLGALLRYRAPLRPRIDTAAWREALRAGAPILGYSFARAAIYSADLVLIAVLLEHADAGHYGAAYKPVLFVSGALGLFFVSLLAALGEGDRAGRDELVRRALRFVPVVVLMGTVALSASAPVTVPLVFGEQYEPAIAVLAVLAWTLPIQAVGGTYWCLLIAAGRQQSLLRANAAGALGNFLVNLAAIPLLGIVGAAAVTVATELLIVLANRRTARRLGLSPRDLSRSSR